MLDHILITNDDGIDAPGLAVLVSHAVSLHHPVARSGTLRRGLGISPGRPCGLWSFTSESAPRVAHVNLKGDQDQVIEIP